MEEQKKSRWITPGLAVIHISNLDKILTVDHVIYVSKKYKDEKGNEIRKSRIDGVKCKYYDEHGNLKFAVHHTKELVPHSIASIGNLEAYKFINKEGKYKNY